MKLNRQNKPRWETIAVYGIPLILTLLFFIVYAWMQMTSIYGGDAGDLTTNAYLWGIPHPPGYPLYTFLSGLFIRICSFGTVAWRVCFLSSIPSAVTVFFLWRLSFRLTRSYLASTVASVVYGLLGPVWLNAITQEVFGLFSLFTIVWIERFVTWLEEKQVKQLLFLAFWTGLSLTHHQLIVLCIVPAIFLVFSRFRKLRHQMFVNWWKILVCGFVGLLPCLYIPIVSRFSTPFDQENAQTIEGFIRLVTRASYGSFRAYANATPSLIDRALNIFTFFQFSLRDIGIIGCIAIFIGVVVLRKKKRELYEYLIGCLFLWIFYFFYAGFPSILNYHIGTIERFFVVPYQLLILFCAIGLAQSFKWIRSRMMSKLFQIVVKGIVIFALFLLLFPQFQNNARAFITLRTDLSMEQLATDILTSAPKNSIVFLYNDTTLYAMNNALFVRHKRADIHVVRLQLFGLAHYRVYLRKQYPDIYVPPETVDASTPAMVADFIVQNVMKFPILSDKQITEISGLWIPNGLLYAYVPDEKATIDHTAVVEVNTTVWNNFIIPTRLLTYQKELPMLSDVLRIYSQQRLNFVIECLIANMPIERVKDELTHALELAINVVPEQYLRPVTLLISQKQCAYAKELLRMFYQKWGNDKAVLEQYELWSGSCGSDEEVDAKVMLYRKYFPQKSGSLSQ